MRYNFKDWLYYAGIRAIKTIAQSALGALVGSTLFTEVDWKVVGSTALLAGILSLLTSIAGIPEVDNKISETFDEEKGED